MKKYANKILIGLIVFTILIGLIRGIFWAGSKGAEGKFYFNQGEIRFENVK